MYYGQHYPHYRGANEQGTLPEDNWTVPQVGSLLAWVTDPEGRHRLWFPIEWRTHNAGWLYNMTTLWLNRGDGTIIIKL